MKRNQEEPLRLEYKIIKSQPAKLTALIAATGSTANNISQSQQQWRNKNSSTEVGNGGTNTTLMKRSSAPSPQSTPPKQQKLSLSIKRPGLRNQVEPTHQEDVVQPIRRSSSSKRSSDSSKKRAKKKRKRRKSSMDLVPIMEPQHPLKVKIVERVKSTEYHWQQRSNGVELLVKAAELASRQNPTPPPPPVTKPPEEPKITRSLPPLLPISTVASGDSVNNNSKPPEEEEVIRPLTLVAAAAEEIDAEDDGSRLMIADEGNLNSSNSNGRDSGMANDDDEDDSAGALDLSSKSSRATPPEELNSKIEPAKSVSPQLIQQRSTTLHSITDSLAQRQRQRLIQQQQQDQQRRIQHPDAIRNLVTLSQTASLVPPHPERAATQRLIVAMHQFAAAAAAAAASAPPRPPKTPPHPSKSLSAYGLLKRPF